MKFSVETWDPAYGASVDTADMEASSEPVDAEVEVSTSEWQPIDPPSAVSAAPPLVFVDGIRRIDARVWITHDGTARPGVCATVAAGAVRVVPGRAEVTEVAVERAVYARAEGASAIITRGGTYELVPAAGDEPEQMYLAIHQHMTRLEVQISSRIDADSLLVFDGPLRGRVAPNGVGYVKTQHRQYLDDSGQRLLGVLEPGQRSPVFLIGGRFSRYSWYLRLPGPRTHPLAGVVRCEVPGRRAVAEAVATADLVTHTLPRFASEAHKDGRAPQNLYPIAGLEQTLRRRLGDARLLERALRVASDG